MGGGSVWGGGVLFGAKPRISEERREDIRQMLRVLDHDIQAAKTATYMEDDEELKREIDNLSGRFIELCESNGYFNRLLEDYF